MKPVEIEFLMRDKLTPGLEKAGRSAESLGDTAEKTAKKLSKKLADTKADIKYVENYLKSLKAEYKTLPKGTAQKEMKAEIDACSKSLCEQKMYLVQLESEYRDTATTTQRLSKELRQLLDSTARMRLEGKQNSAEYNEMSARAAKLSDTIGDLRTQTNILAHDDAGLQGVISGVNGISGAFTAATGLMGVFASENENLIKIQTRVQSVMAVTMGLQQVFNTLNKDSAFRLVTVRKAKDLLSAANTRLATSLGISNVAAKALMGTLTLGLSVAVGLAIGAIEKYSAAQEKAAEKSRALLEVEKEGRAQMVRAQVEIDAAKKSVKDFTGTKEQERLKIEELNRQYGESFGYYSSLSQWYDVLSKKGGDYAQVLLLQAKAQALVNKAVEADAKITEIENTKPEDVEGSAGFFRKWWYYLMWGTSNGAVDGGGLIQKYNESAKAKALQTTKDMKDGYLKEIESLNDRIAQIMKGSGIGGHVDPNNNKGDTKPKNTLAEMELEAARHIENARLELIREGYWKEREEARLNFEREKERIAAEEKERVALYEKLKAAGGDVTPGQLANIHAQASTQRIQAAHIYDRTIDDITARENKDASERRKKREDELRSLLDKYQDYEARRVEIGRQGDADIKALEAARTAENSGEIDRAIDVAKKKVREGIQAINDEEAQSVSENNDFLRSLFGDYAGMGMDALRNLISQARQLKDYLNGKGSAEGITFISAGQLKNIESSPAELDKLKKALDRLLDGGKGTANKWEGIFKAFRTGIASLRGSKGAVQIAGAVGAIASAAQEATSEIGAMIDQLGDSGIRDAVADADMLMGAIANIGQGFAKGGLIGGIGAAVGEGLKFLTSAFVAEARHKEALREIDRARLDFQRQYNLLLLEQNLLMEEAQSVFGEKQVEKAANAVEVYRKAFSQLKDELRGEAPVQNFFERVTGDAAGTYAKRLEAFNAGVGALYDARIVTGHKKTGLFGWGKGKDVYGSILSVYPELIKANGELDTEMLRVILDTRKMSDETRGYLENLIELKGAMEEAEDALENYLSDTFGALGDGMMDAVTSALQGSGTALENFAASAAGVLENLGEQIAYSLFFADEFAALQERLKSVYGSGKGEEAIADEAMGVIDSFYDNIGKNVDAAQVWMEAWRDKAASLGYKLWEDDDGGAAQAGRHGVYTALSQEQGTKLEGLFTSVQAHTASIDERLDGFMETFGALCEAVGDILKRVDRLPEMVDDIHELRVNGIKLRSL